jgi:ribosomal protein S18 acetylase RimI-like enzyme
LPSIAATVEPFGSGLVMNNKLHLLWSIHYGLELASVKLPHGYAIRPYHNADLAQWTALMRGSGFFLNPDDEVPQMLEDVRPRLLRDGMMVVVHCTAGVVATDMMTHNPTMLYPNAVELRWITVDQPHRGMGLGRALTAAQLEIAVGLGYENVFVETDPDRIASIKNCLALGFRPCLYAPDSLESWSEVCRQEKLAFTPEQWPCCGISRA